VEVRQIVQKARDAQVTIQKQIEEKITNENASPRALVKEDFSPLNTKRDRLIVEYAPLIKYISQRIAARLPANIELDDLMSSGVIGLMDAIDKYDPSRDNKFKTYAEFRIRGAILDELRAQDWVPRSIREKSKVIELAMIDAGASDIGEQEGVFEIRTKTEQFQPVVTWLKQQGIEPVSAELSWFPKEETPVPEEAKEELGALCSALEEHDDTADYYMNAA
jgi:RNA polymerase sigma factor for flagellar operon FliA